ncbi:hypothetical protein KIPB_004507 [Kipferlia bialata]|uniref:Uncharacterized protein n=1 Tax=Kipferlia bialata TaxID=797122 RepID=A0A391NLA2_9EUKA|nr:hypothetical protein KIPB_004507 [Kipferlia bialata]|eukprot:g4507.t1
MKSKLNKNALDLTNYIYKDYDKQFGDKYYYKTKYSLADDADYHLYRTLNDVSLVVDGENILVLNDNKTLLSLMYKDSIITNTDMMSYNYGSELHILIQLLSTDNVTSTVLILKLDLDPDTGKYVQKANMQEIEEAYAQVKMLRLACDKPGYLYNYTSGCIECYEIQEEVLKGVANGKGSYNWATITDVQNTVIDFYYNSSKKVCCYLDASNSLYFVNLTHSISTIVTNFYLYNGVTEGRMTINYELSQLLYVKNDIIHKIDLASGTHVYTYDISGFASTLYNVVWNVAKDILLLNIGGGKFLFIDLVKQTHVEKPLASKHIILCQNSTLLNDDCILSADSLMNPIVDCSDSTIMADNVMIRINENTQVSLKDMWLKLNNQTT